MTGIGLSELVLRSAMPSTPGCPTDGFDQPSEPMSQPLAKSAACFCPEQPSPSAHKSPTLETKAILMKLIVCVKHSLSLSLVSRGSSSTRRCSACPRPGSQPRRAAGPPCGGPPSPRGTSRTSLEVSAFNLAIVRKRSTTSAPSRCRSQ